MNMTNPNILEAEKNGMPIAEPESIDCPTCGHPTYERNLRQCEVHKHEGFCPFCPGVIWIPTWGWNFCNAETAIDYLTEKIQDADAEIYQLKQAAIEAKKGE